MISKKTTYKIILPVFFAAVVFMLIAVHNTSAQATPLLNFIGKVTNIDGSEVADGVYDFNFGLYTAPTGGAAIWSEDLTAATRFSGTISSAVEGANSITYTYSGEAATSTFRLGQYLYNASTSAAALIIDYNTGANTVTVASGSPLWNSGQGINNRPFVEGGIININLGSVTDLSGVDFNQTLYLEITFNSEIMQPRKLLTTEAHAFDAARLGGRAASEFAALPEDETVTGEWSFNNIVSMATSASDTVLTVVQNGSGNIVDFKLGTTTALAVLDDGRVQIGDYYFPASRAGSNAGYVLKIDALGNLSWANDLAGSGGGSGLWASTTGYLFQANTGDIVVIGNNATTSPYGSKLDVTGDAWFDNILVSNQQQLRFYDAGSLYYTAIRASTSLASNFILTLPDSAGAPGQALLTDGSGNLSWGAPSGGTVYVNPGAVGQLGYYASAGSTLSATSSIFLSHAGYFGIGTATPANLLSVGGVSGGQFLVDNSGQVVGGVWQSSIIGAAYGGTGTTTAGWTGVPFIAAGAWSPTSTLSAQYGGTGFSSFNAGDLLYAGDANSYVLLPIGNEGEILVVSPAGIPSWVSTTSLNLDVANMTGILDASHGGTGQNFGSSTGFIYLDNGTAIASATVAITYTDLAASSGIVLSGNMLTLDNTGNWSGTFDNEDGTYYLNAINLTNFDIPWSAQMAATTTDALMQGSVNRYYSTLLFAADLAATTTDALAQGVVNRYYSTNLFAADLAGTSTDALAEGMANLYWTDSRFDARLNATTSLPNLAALTGLQTVGTISTGTWQGDVLSVGYGGTGTTTFEANSILYAPLADTVSEILAGSNGYVLKMSGGVPTWQPDLTVGGESQFWASTSDMLAIYPTDVNDVIVIGFDATSSRNIILEVVGNALFSGSVSAQSLSLVNALAVSEGGTGSTTPTGILLGDGAGNIVTLGNNSTDWNTAYSWGDHSSQNYFDTDTDILTVALGGTGTTTFSANSLLYASAADTVSEILPGLNGYALVMQGNTPTWSSTTPGVAHEILSAQHSDVEATTTRLQGDLLRVDSSGNWNRLGLGANGYILRSNGTDASWMPTTNITELGTITSGAWNADIIDIAHGGTGAATVAEARENLDLDEIYKFAVNSTGTVGWLWQSDGNGRGQWKATTTLGFRSGSGSGSPASKFVGTTTLEYDGHFSSSTLEGYMAANSICDAEFPDSHFCRTYDILVTIEQDDISGWGGRAWIAEGPPGFTSDSNDCNGWTTNDSDKYGAWWDFDPNGGAGWLIYCNYTRPLACCLRQ